MNTYTTVFVRIPYVLRTYSYVSMYVSVRIAYVSRPYSYVFVRIFPSTQAYVLKYDRSYPFVFSGKIHKLIRTWYVRPWYVFVCIRKYHVRILVRIPYVYFKLPSWCSLHKNRPLQASSRTSLLRLHLPKSPNWTTPPKCYAQLPQPLRLPLRYAGCPRAISSKQFRIAAMHPCGSLIHRRWTLPWHGPEPWFRKKTLSHIRSCNTVCQSTCEKHHWAMEAFR